MQRIIQGAAASLFRGRPLPGRGLSTSANNSGSGPVLLGGAAIAGGGAYYMYSTREESSTPPPEDAQPALVRELAKGTPPVLTQDDRQSQTIDELQGLLAAAVST